MSGFFPYSPSVESALEFQQRRSWSRKRCRRMPRDRSEKVEGNSLLFNQRMLLVGNSESIHFCLGPGKLENWWTLGTVINCCILSSWEKHTFSVVLFHCACFSWVPKSSPSWNPSGGTSVWVGPKKVNSKFGYHFKLGKLFCWEANPPILEMRIADFFQGSHSWFWSWPWWEEVFSLLMHSVWWILGQCMP